MIGPTLLSLALALQEVTPPAAVDFADLELEIQPPVLAEMRERLGAPSDQVRGSWSGKLGASEVEIMLLTFPHGEWGLEEAGEVTDVMVDWLREKDNFDVAESFEYEGNYGITPVLSGVAGPIQQETRKVGVQYVASGLLAKHGYSLHVRLQPQPDEAGKQQILDFLKNGIAFGGARRDPKWTEEEVVARWKRSAPESLHADFERNLSKKAWVKNAILRTEHYLVMTSSSGGEKFAQQLERNYAAIGKVFTLPSGKGCKLMPVFLFRSPEEYYDFCVKRGMDYESAKRSKGHASGDYYATWYESPTDPTHIHEQTHQIFGNRLFLNGGGSWFQEGVAEYIESSANDRNVLASMVAKKKHLPLVDFVQRQSLLWSSAESRKEGGSEASELYTQAGLFIEFLRESKFGKGKFEQFLQTIGRCSRKLEPLRLAFREVYGLDLEKLDEEFQAYCAKR